MLFRVFSDSGGPSLPLGPFPPEWRKHPEYASLRLFTVLGPLVPLDRDRGKRSRGPTPGRLNRAGSLLPAVLGLHTAQNEKTAGSRLFVFS